MNLAIHIGYHKTATTWLQREVFTPTFGFSPLMGHKDVDRLILQPHDLEFDADTARCQLQQSAGGYSVISSENLSGHPFFGGRQSATLAHRLQKIAPHARIVITVRSQETMLPSVYMQYLQRGGTLGHQAFFEGSSGFGYPGFELRHFQYHRLIALYQSLFEHVHVMTFEKISQNADAAISSLFHALGHAPPTGAALNRSRVSASMPQAIAPVLRAINHTRKSTLNPSPALTLSREPGWMYRAITATARARRVTSLLTSRPLSTYVSEQFSEAFTDSNRQLGLITKGTLDLSSYP
ncbi:hypothetical protein [uncultured Litoreibacter sp.]|uniref:hypothetical protein n=1 Tax=uncultured Litoreibacter sp. TaxID=1392394 RepID=UPI002621632F|nr:hypothetical protein [uncultured Litoreibacter sp.]